MGKPELRFPEFTEEWEEVILNDVLKRVSKPVDVEKETLYRQIGIRSHGKGLFYKEDVTGKELGNKRVFWIEPDCLVLNIVFAWERAVARTTKNEVGMIASHRFPMYKTADDRLDLDYAVQYLTTKRGSNILILASPGGAGRNKTLGQEAFLKSIMLLPNIKEQKRIVELLKAINDVIAVEQKQVLLWEEKKKCVMQRIFSQEIRYKADNGSDFPEWEEKKLCDVGTFYGGLSGKTKEDFGKGNRKYITYMNVCRNTFVKQDLLESVDVKDGEKQHTVKYGDILFTQSSETVEEVGMSSVYLFYDEPCLNSFCMGFHLNNLICINPIYMGYLMRSQYVRRAIMKEGQGISRINLAASRILNIKLAIPCYDEQTKIANCLASIDEVITVKQNKVKIWETIYNGLLQQMFI